MIWLFFAYVLASTLYQLEWLKYIKPGRNFGKILYDTNNLMIDLLNH